jgi:tetratricopeptide (TPR) repeat protein
MKRPYMISETAGFVSGIPMWVAATKGVRLPTPPPPEELDRRVREVRALLREGNAEAIDIDAGDEGLAVLSRLCFELSNESDECHELLFREASIAYAIVSRIPWPSEGFGERDEILSDLALAAWRSSRQVHSARVAQEWERRHQEAVSKSAALRACLEHYITTNAGDRTDELRQSFFSDARTLLAMVALLRLRRNATPHVVAELGSELFDWVQSSGVQASKKELIYLLADLSVLVGACCRFIGSWHAARAWLSRAESLFQKTARPEAGLARVAFARLALACETHRHEEVLRRIPDLHSEFVALGMEEEAAICRFVQGASLEALGRSGEATEILSTLRSSLLEQPDHWLLGHTTSKLAEVLALSGRFDDASGYYRQALVWLGDRPSWARASLKAYLGGTLRDTGNLTPAVTAFREAVADYSVLGFKTKVAYIRMLLAETLLLADRPREAEVEILAALPTIEEQEMAAEGIVAISLLRESIRQSRLDGEVLRQVREHLKEGWR